ncbi:SDR family oxidoreductase [Salmonella enterica]|nr:SDR family oxidoreductase [Salmonella enterica]EIE7938457.1 SDR family oxidoreductase [Salmonella enterica]
MKSGISGQYLGRVNKKGGLIPLKNKVFIVTGACSGIGFASVQEIVNQGGKVILTTREDNAVALSEACQMLGDHVTKWVTADLADISAPQRIVEYAQEQFGRVDGLVNNAACFPRNDLKSITTDVFDMIMAVNVRSPLFLIRELLNEIGPETPTVTVVNIGSINAYCGQPDLLGYSISKGALQTMTRNLADAHAGQGLRINQLNVGWTLTQSERNLQRKLGRPDNWVNNISPVFAPRGSILAPDEIAQHVAFWLSDRSAPINGSICDLEQYPVIGRNKIASS